MTAPILFGDARSEVRAALDAALTGRPEAYAQGVTVGVEEGTSPHVAVVSSTPTGGRFPITQQCTVRVVVWHESDLEAHDLAQLARSLLLTSATGAHLAGCFPLTGPFLDVDPDNGQPMAAFTVRAAMCGR